MRTPVKKRDRLISEGLADQPVGKAPVRVELTMTDLKPPGTFFWDFATRLSSAFMVRTSGGLGCGML